MAILVKKKTQKNCSRVRLPLGDLGEGFLLSTKVVGRSEKIAVKNS